MSGCTSIKFIVKAYVLSYHNLVNSFGLRHFFIPPTQLTLLHTNTFGGKKDVQIFVKNKESRSNSKKSSCDSRCSNRRANTNTRIYPFSKTK